jgi:hypothetical protein
MAAACNKMWLKKLSSNAAYYVRNANSGLPELTRQLNECTECKQNSHLLRNFGVVGILCQQLNMAGAGKVEEEICDNM